MKAFITNSSLETERLGEEFAKELKGGDVICLYGDLGSGKTTFTKGLAKGLSIKSRIISPTFILMRQHEIKVKSQKSKVKTTIKNSKLRYLYHIDLYRLENENAIESLGLEDLFKDKGSVIVIEWAEKLGELLPSRRVDIFFKTSADKKRKILIKTRDEFVKNEMGKAVDILNNGGVVIFPTDTAFGIGCRMDDEKAVRRLFEIRKRPQNQPTPVLVDSVQMAQEYLEPIDDQIIKKLVKPYWPGALTIILKCKKEKIPSLVRGGGDTLGVRMPDHEITLSIIREVGVPILGPSANFHGEKTPYSLQEVDKKLLKMVDYVVNGECKLKKSSTIIDVTKKPWEVLRKGAVELMIESKVI